MYDLVNNKRSKALGVFCFSAFALRQAQGFGGQAIISQNKSRAKRSFTKEKIKIMVLFLVGFLEMIIISLWTKAVSDNKIVISGVITIVNTFIWYYVLQVVINDISNFYLIILYASGCALGTMITTAFFHYQDNFKKTIRLPKFLARQIDKN